MHAREQQRPRLPIRGSVIFVALASAAVALTALLPLAPRRPATDRPIDRPEREAPIADALAQRATAPAQRAPAPAQSTTEPALAPRPRKASVSAQPESTPERDTVDEAAGRWALEEEDHDATRSSLTAVAEEIRNLAVDGMIEHLSCRTTLCGARLRFASMNDALRLDADGADPNVAKMLKVVSDESGQLVVDVYWPREGDQVPVLH